MAIIRNRQRNGTVYVYQSDSYWDDAKQKQVTSRKLIGKVDPETGEIVPTGKVGRHRKDDPKATADTTIAEKYWVMYQEACKDLTKKDLVIHRQKKQVERVIREQEKLLEQVTEIITASIERNRQLLAQMEEESRAKAPAQAVGAPVAGDGAAAGAPAAGTLAASEPAADTPAGEPARGEKPGAENGGAAAPKDRADSV